MSYKAFFNLGIACILFLLPGYKNSEQEGKDAKPNVIFIFPDQYRNSSLGIWSEPGYDKYLQGKGDPVVTPALNKFAMESVVFNRAVSNYPLCSPYRGMFISGMYPKNNGITNNCRAGREVSLRRDLKAITDIYGENGYDVSYFGKMHLIKNEPLFDEKGTYRGTSNPPGGHRIGNYDTYVPPGPDRHGIQYFFQVLFDEHFNPRVYSNDPALVGGRKDGEQYLPKRFNAEIESEAIIDYLENNRSQRDTEKPFFMIWSLNPPHNQWTKESTKMEFFDLYTNNGKVNFRQLLTHKNADSISGSHAPFYFANVTAVDYYIGKVLQKLEELNLSDNTIVAFSSDHGEMLGSHGRDGKNVPQLESINIPFMIKWGNRFKHRVEDRIVNVPDVMPTLLSLSGLENEIPKEVQGQDFSSLILNSESKNEKPSAALLMGAKYRGVYTGKYTFVTEEKNGKIDSVYAYNNEADPYQLLRLSVNDLGRETEKSLKSELIRLLEETEDSWLDNKVGKNYLSYN